MVGTGRWDVQTRLDQRLYTLAHNPDVLSFPGLQKSRPVSISPLAGWSRICSQARDKTLSTSTGDGRGGTKDNEQAQLGVYSVPPRGAGYFWSVLWNTYKRTVFNIYP